ncbi:hypothetical protein [Cohnella faecalis]|uniref:hypothetical protein n=1 Tax=Cohnella faecalis TaxID=2315694 RepID=UPI001313FCF2|nr:hypothetical protein [Cohnella faecalis]
MKKSVVSLLVMSLVLLALTACSEKKKEAEFPSKTIRIFIPSPRAGRPTCPFALCSRSWRRSLANPSKSSTSREAPELWR